MGEDYKKSITFPEITFATLFGIIFGILGLGSIKYINPSFVEWIKGDNLTSYIAQLFYLSDRWRYPLLINPNYGTDLATSLTYTGPSSPILLIQKLFRIDPTFQFYGIWVVLNVIFHILFAIKIAKHFQLTEIQKYGFALLTLTPFIFFRMQMHFWLISHYLVLWAILNLVRYLTNIKSKLVSITANVTIAYLSNTYIFAMVFIVYLTIALHKIFSKNNKDNRYNLLIALAANSFISIFIFDGFKNQKTPYETIKMFLSSTYGYHPSNIFSWINPSTGLLVESNGINNGLDITNFSILDINLGNIAGDYEGYNYLGLGNILLILIAIFVVYSMRQDVLRTLIKNRFFLTSALLIISFSISYRIGIGSLEVKFPFPEYLKWIFGTFRSSGRFLWVISYSIILLATLVIVRSNKIRRGYVSVIIAVCAFINLSEISILEVNRMHNIANANLEPELNMRIPKDFSAIVNRGDKIKVFPQGDVLDNNYANLNFWAWSEKARTNILYTSRINMREMYRVERETFRELCSGNFMSSNIYVVQNEMLYRFKNCQLSKLQTRVIGVQTYFYREGKLNVK